MSELAIRPARAEDLEALLALYAELAEEAGPAPAPDSEARRVLEEILAQPMRHLTVASRDGRVVASADMLIVANLTHGGRPWAIIENVVVTAMARRSGVGSRLMGYLMWLARASGCYKVQLLSADHRRAKAFYEHLGFQALSTGFKIYFEDGPAEAAEG